MDQRWPTWIHGPITRLLAALGLSATPRNPQLLLQASSFRTLLEHLEHPLLILDAAGRVALANARASELLAAGAAGWADFLAQPAVAEMLAAARRGVVPPRRQIRLSVAGHPRMVQLSVAPVRPAAEAAEFWARPRPGVPAPRGAARARRGTSATRFPCVAPPEVFLGILLLMEDQTELLQSMQIKADFAANASHELRTPLASIRAAVETMRSSGLHDRAVAERCLGIIGGHVRRLQLLVQDLLDLSRTEDSRAILHLEPIDLAELRDAMLGLFGASAQEKHLELRFPSALDVKTITADERLIILILKNLLDNSLKFTSSGWVEVRWSRRGTATVLQVRDTGCGIPPEDIGRVFERFYTVNRSRGGADRGTGLGLAIVKHAVAALGGVVELESTPGVGTTVRCVWPVPPRAESPAAPAVRGLPILPDPPPQNPATPSPEARDRPGLVKPADRL